jgi:hypothetical protein
MADIPQNIPGAPAGAVPPAKKETGKVQPKKETVRINLPPKPSTAPTIKLPTLPPGGPTGASGAVPPPAALKSPAAPAAAPSTGARSAVPAAAAPATAQPRSTATAPKAAPAGPPTIGALDRILIMAAAVAGLFAIGTVVWMFMILKDAAVS